MEAFTIKQGDENDEATKWYQPVVRLGVLAAVVQSVLYGVLHGPPSFWPTIPAPPSGPSWNKYKCANMYIDQ